MQTDPDISIARHKLKLPLATHEGRVGSGVDIVGWIVGLRVGKGVVGSNEGSSDGSGVGSSDGLGVGCKRIRLRRVVCEIINQIIKSKE